MRGVRTPLNLLTKHERLLRLEKAAADRAIPLSEEQTQALERFSLSSASVTSKRPILAPLSSSILSSSAPSREWARSIYRPPLTAIPATPGQALPIQAVGHCGSPDEYDVLPTFRADAHPRLYRGPAPNHHKGGDRTGKIHQPQSRLITQPNAVSFRMKPSLKKNSNTR